MRFFEQLNRVLSVVSAIIVVGIGGYIGVSPFRASRGPFHAGFRKGLEHRIRESEKSPPFGFRGKDLNGEYRKDGPLSDYYRDHPNGVTLAEDRNRSNPSGNCWKRRLGGGFLNSSRIVEISNKSAA